MTTEIHERGYTKPDFCGWTGHHFRRTDLRVCVRCGFFDQRYPVATRLLAEDYLSRENDLHCETAPPGV